MGLAVRKATVTNKPPPSHIEFTPAAYFDEWLESVERFWEGQRAPASAEIVIDGEDVNFSATGVFNNALEKLKNPGTLVLGEHASLQADIVVASALIDGVLKGNITASESVVVENHAIVIGDINTPRLTIRGGAIIEGECFFEDLREPEAPPVWAALKGSLARVWRSRLFQ